MRASEITPGFYRFQPVQTAPGFTDLIRVEGRVEPRWKGDRAVIRATRFFVSGPREIRIAPHRVVVPAEPDKRTMSIIRMIEEEANRA